MIVYNRRSFLRVNKEHETFVIRSYVHICVRYPLLYYSVAHSRVVVLFVRGSTTSFSTANSDVQGSRVIPTGLMADWSICVSSEKPCRISSTQQVSSFSPDVSQSPSQGYQRTCGIILGRTFSGRKSITPSTLPLLVCGGLVSVWAHVIQRQPQ